VSLDFMVISAERSGSTWVANWLTTDTSICYHDPRLRWTEEQLRTLKCGKKRVGIACTFAGLDPEWCNRQLCPTVILHRPQNEVDASWRRMGFIPFVKQPALDAVGGWHVKWDAPRDPALAKEIYEYLLWKEFDAERHHELCMMNVQPHLPGLHIIPKGFAELTTRITEAMNK